ARALRLHSAAVQHARLADGEVADVDHLLHLTIAFFLDLAGLERNQAAECGFVSTKLFDDEPHQLATAWRRDDAPAGERSEGVVHHGVVLAARAAPDPAEHLLIRRIEGGEIIGGRKPLRPEAYAGIALGESKLGEKRVRQVHEGTSRSAR